jgi:L-amino acid N-acyltransferase YncA
MRVRPAGPEDASGMAAVHVAGWRAAYPGLIAREAIEARTLAVREAQWRAAFAGPEERGPWMWVAEEEGRVAGFASAGPCRDQEPEPELGELYTLYLDPAFIGRGVGRALLERALAGLREHGFTEAVLWVLASNQRARRFYEAAGFRWDGGHRHEEEMGPQHRDLRYRRAL